MDRRECGSKTVSDVLGALDDTRGGVDINPEQGVGKGKADAEPAYDTPSRHAILRADTRYAELGHVKPSYLYDAVR